jgi:putative DNA primase/helicase
MTPAEDLTSRLGGRWHGSFGTCRCPLHDDREPSLSIRDGERAPLLTCHAGCDRRTIIGELLRSGLWSRAAQYQPEPGTKPRRPAADTRRLAVAIWRGSRPIAGTPAERYLRGRAIRTEIPPSLRYHPRLKHSDTGRLLPAMVAAVQAPDRSIAAIHRTFLMGDGTGKAQVPSPRKMLGAVRGGAVRLAIAGFELGIGEGLETCLAFQQVTGVSTWAALSTSGMRSVILPPLPLAATVLLVVDLDPAGEDAAQAAAARLSREGRRVRLARPVVGNDMADALAEAGYA